MDILRRIEDAVNAVEQRLRTTVATLASAKIPHAVTDDNAVAAHVTRVDKAAIRHTPDVSILIRPEDFDAAVRAMRSAGFTHDTQLGSDLFLDTWRLIQAGSELRRRAGSAAAISRFFGLHQTDLVSRTSTCSICNAA
jgi:hypothetical protein